MRLQFIMALIMMLVLLSGRCIADNNHDHNRPPFDTSIEKPKSRTPRDVTLRTLPRLGRHFDKSGHYDLCIRLRNTVIDPGDSLHAEVFISGYGEIDSPKLVFYPSDDIFGEGSFVEYGLKKQKKNVHVFGGQKSSIRDTGLTLLLHGGIMKEGWKSPTLFFDISSEEGSRQISTETKQDKAPIELLLKTKDSILPGRYKIDFAFTYFNGTEWKGSLHEVEFSVRSFFQRHETMVAWIAAFAAVSTIISAILKLVSRFSKKESQVIDSDMEAGPS